MSLSSTSRSRLLAICFSERFDFCPIAASYGLKYNKHSSFFTPDKGKVLRFINWNITFHKYFKMELLCVEVIMKRKELLGITNDPNPSDANVDKNVRYCPVFYFFFGCSF